MFHSDRSRHNDLPAVAGHEVLHVIQEHMLREAERVIVWITVALQKRGGW